MSDENFLSRWSRRKHAAAAGVRSEDAAAATTPVPPGAATPAPAASAEPAPPAELPPVASLSIESDFAPFMAKEVDPSLQRAALRKLFQDERFNVMDGLDVYIDDYTKPAPIPQEWYEPSRRRRNRPRSIRRRCPKVRRPRRRAPHPRPIYRTTMFLRTKRPPRPGMVHPGKLRCSHWCKLG
jgi:hypothetical protein